MQNTIFKKEIVYYPNQLNTTINNAKKDIFDLM